MRTMKKAREASPVAHKIAKDIFTVPNLISVTGAALAIHGSEKIDTAEGLAECAVGRLADVLDGKVARMIGQTSNFGAALDATTDKIVMAKILYEMHKKGAGSEVCSWHCCGTKLNKRRGYWNC